MNIPPWPLPVPFKPGVADTTPIRHRVRARARERSRGLHILSLEKPRRLCGRHGDLVEGRLRRTATVSCAPHPHPNPGSPSLLQDELAPGTGHGGLTVALSRTFTESSSATLCFRRASSRVQRGRFSHFPNTTRSMSLDTEHTPAGVGRGEGARWVERSLKPAPLARGPREPAPPPPLRAPGVVATVSELRGGG